MSDSISENLEERDENEEEEEMGEAEELTVQEPQNICDEVFSSEQENHENEKKVQSTRRAAESESPEQQAEAPLVLQPDHPMMERFQAALKAHLLKQLERLNNLTFELDNDIKMKEKEKEEIGLLMYARQQDAFRQQKVLEDCEVSIEELMKERQTLDETVSLKKKSWKEEMNRLNSMKKAENDKLSELRKLSSLEKQMEKWEKEVESELTISQRISEKSQHDKQKMVEEKRKMDMYLLKLMTAVSNAEAEIKLLEAEIDLKTEEKDSLNQTLLDAAADLQCLDMEQKRLLAAWKSVVSTVDHRNIIYTDINRELTKCQEGFLCLNKEIESYKRSSAEEMKKSEKLAITLSHMQNDYESYELNLKNLMHKKENVEEKVAGLATIIDRTEIEYEYAKAEADKNERILKKLSTSIDAVIREKRKYEDEVTTSIQEQIIKNSSSSDLGKLVKAGREKSRVQELNMLEIENKISQKFLEVEERKEIVARNNEIMKEMENELNIKEEELKKYNDEISKCHSEIIKKQTCYATLHRKIERQAEVKNSEKPLSQQIMDLEKANAEIQAKNDKLQSFWLIQQNNNVKLSQQRNKQLKDISLLRRQVLLLEQRAVKIELEFDKESQIENDITKVIVQLQRRLTELSDTLMDKNEYRENLGKENALTQAQYLQNLKDAELEQIRLKAEIKDLETNLEELAESMLSTQREMLVWEKKIQSAIEAKTDMQKEKSSLGDIGQMRAEIHRMEVRQGQLKKVQEKLITDLEQCVLRRDAIAEGADALERRQTRGLNLRFNLQKKIEGLKNNIRTVCNEQKQIEKIIGNTEEGHSQLRKAILEKEGKLLQMEETTKKIDQQLQEGKLHKCQNLDMLLRRQKKCKLYELVKSGKHRLLFKNEGVIEAEIQKAKSKNSDLISVLEALIENFPAYQFELRKIYNTVKASPS